NETQYRNAGPAALSCTLEALIRTATGRRRRARPIDLLRPRSRDDPEPAFAPGPHARRPAAGGGCDPLPGGRVLACERHAPRRLHRALARPDLQGPRLRRPVAPAPRRSRARAAAISAHRPSRRPRVVP